MHKILILGAAGFIGTNLAIALAKNPENELLLVDEKSEYFEHYPLSERVTYKIINYQAYDEVAAVVKDRNIVYHLISTNNPSSSNMSIENDVSINVIISTNILEACRQNNIEKVVFLSSGGTVYGKDAVCPIKESAENNPITTYGIQKLAIEKLLYLYSYLYGLNYVIIRLSNPFGPFQRPNGKLGVITTFVYKALCGEKVHVYGDGTVIRDYIYIDDAIAAILKVVEGDAKESIYNIGSGKGTSIRDIILLIQSCLEQQLEVVFEKGRSVDVPVNYLDISRYENEFGKMRNRSLKEGIQETILFWKKILQDEK